MNEGSFGRRISFDIQAHCAFPGQLGVIMEISPVSLKILTVLRQSGTDVSGEALCRDLAISRAAVWKHIQVLRGLGYKIESATHRGYRLSESANYPYPWEIEPLLNTQCFGREIQFREVLDSTNLLAGEAAKNNAPEGFCVIADRQLRGRGRLQRRWFSPAGKNLYLSLILRPSVLPAAISQISLVAALAGARVLDRELPESKVEIKWPNDLLVDGKKAAGILCESSSELDRVHYAAVGIGVNVNLEEVSLPCDLQGLVNSIRLAGGREASRPRLTANLLNTFEPLYQHWLQNGLADLLPELERFSALIQREVEITTVRGTIEGRVLGISSDGGLRVKPGNRTEEEIIYCGDTRLLA